jgi:hypothetical protein
MKVRGFSHRKRKIDKRKEAKKEKKEEESLVFPVAAFFHKSPTQTPPTKQTNERTNEALIYSRPK